VQGEPATRYNLKSQQSTYSEHCYVYQTSWHGSVGRCEERTFECGRSEEQAGVSTSITIRLYY